MDTDPVPPSRSSERPSHDPVQVLRTEDVLRLIRLSRPTLHRLRVAGDFPPPIQLSRQAIGWRRADVEQWLRERPVSTGGRRS